MKKTIYYIIAILLVSILIFQSGTKSVIADDDDDDGVDDDFEDLNERDISIDPDEFEVDEIEIEAILRRGAIRDEIEYELSNNTDGFYIETDYERESGSDEFELEFTATFVSIVEFNDTNGDGMYNDTDPSEYVKELKLNNFQKTIYKNETLSAENTLHILIINTTDGVFTAYIYIAEEFANVNGTILSPTQMKVDIEINDFPYNNPNNLLALNITLESEEEYEEEKDTEDEIRGYSENEEWLVTAMNATTGFLSWNKTALVDDKPEPVVIGNGTDVGDDMRMYINYPNGTHIYHDPKVGVAWILKSVVVPPSSGKSDKSKAGTPTIPIFLTPIFILAAVLIIGASVAASSVYYYKKKHLLGRFDEKIGIEPSILTMQDKSSDNISPNSRMKRELLQILEEENALDKITKLGDINLTVISEDFLEVINSFDWEYDEKEEFIKELLALAPKERKEILDEMKEKAFNNSSPV